MLRLSLVIHAGAHILIKFGGGGVNSIVGPTFRIPIYRYRQNDNRSQNNFALFAYSHPIDVGTDFLLFIGFSGPTFYTKLLIFGGWKSPLIPLMCALEYMRVMITLLDTLFGKNS
jgi:hypothetical protein